MILGCGVNTRGIIPYFSDYDIPPNLGGKWGVRLIVRMSLTWLVGDGGGGSSGVGFFSYFPPLKLRWVLWSGVSYSPKNTVLKSVICSTISIQINNYWMNESIISELDGTSCLPQEVILILTQRKLRIHN